MASGLGDNEAGESLGANFSPTESEKVMNNAEARKVRTCEYDGKQIEMPRHIKIGIKDSISETIRVHLDWDSEFQRIVIGYCGKHLFVP